MSATVIEMLNGDDPAFDNRLYWSTSQLYGNTVVSVRWVADGEKHKTAAQFKEHADRIFNNLNRIVGRCTQ